MPKLKAGTLDSLMALSDELSRADAFLESVLRKAERQVAESYTTLKLAAMQADAVKAGSDRLPTAAEVQAMVFHVEAKLPVASYLRSWAWERDKYSDAEALPDLLKR